jgi:hypothetical protein
MTNYPQLSFFWETQGLGAAAFAGTISCFLLAEKTLNRVRSKQHKIILKFNRPGE